ncbi:MAG: ABC transporter permease [Actinomycetota bacterium]|nr:ABC transporter permease [Actinomycetota bacterium]
MRFRAGWGIGASSALVLLLLVTLNFALPRALPGEPIQALSDPRSQTFVGDAARRAAVERYYGLDQGVPEQYGRYLGGLARGDLGTSIRYNAPVTDVLGGRLGWTLLLVGTALALATAAGMLAGVHSGWRRGRPADRRLLGLFLALDGIPVFFLASVAAYVFAVKLGWFPLSGARTPFSQASSALHQAVDIVHHLALPAGVMALQFATLQYLVMRASMVGELGSDHLLLGRLKGLDDRVLKYRYAARNALLPAATVTALQVGFAVTAAIFVETAFAYPGVGRLMFEAVGDRDYPMMQGCFLVLTVLVVGANLLADLSYRRLDPRTSG